MASDIVFNNTNVTNYQNIPSSIYPTIDESCSSLAINCSSVVVSNNILPTTEGIYVSWNYPSSNNTSMRFAVGYQFQVVSGIYTNAQCQTETPPNTVIFEYISNFKTATDEANRYKNLSSICTDQLFIPSNLLQYGQKYTVRIRTLVFSELGAGVVDDKYFKYTNWSILNFNVNNIPFVSGLRVNGEINAQIIQLTLKLTEKGYVLDIPKLQFSFTFNDTDGPRYLYRIQVSNSSSFSTIWWDSGVVDGGTGIGSKEIFNNYSGDNAIIKAPGTYYWRVWVSDGLWNPDSTVTANWTDGTATFIVNAQPQVRDIRINGYSIINSNAGNLTFPTTSNTLSWDYYDNESAVQTAYRITIVPNSNVGLINNSVIYTTEVYSSDNSCSLPALPDSSNLRIYVQVRDNLQWSSLFINGRNKPYGWANINATPEVKNLLVDGLVNPGNVDSTTPTFSWSFYDSSPYDVQNQYQIQVSTTDTFSSTLWDSTVSSSNTSVVYAGTALSHGSYYYARVRVYDGYSWSEWTNAFFSVNTKPNAVTLVSPTIGAYSGNITVKWLPATVRDTDSDTVTYTLELTDKGNTKAGWEYLAGPIADAGIGSIPEVKYIVVVVMDGVRLQDTIDTPANIPFIASMRTTGVTLTNFYANLANTSTIPGHTALLTGHNQDISNLGDEYPSYPSIFAEWLYQNGIVSNGDVGYSQKAKLITAKDKLWCLRQTTNSSKDWENYIPYANCGVSGSGSGGYRSDADTHTVALAQIFTAHGASEPPIISFVGYAGADSAGHTGNYANYVAAITAIDGYVQDLWTHIQADAAMQDKTLLIVTTDHGRQADPNFDEHGGQTEPERHLMFVAKGPRLKSGVNVATIYEQPDLASTLLGALYPAYGKEWADGRIMDIFDDNYSQTYTFDTSTTKAGANYRIRVVANDGYCDSDTLPSTSSIFGISNHVPNTPTFIMPLTATVASSKIRVEWLEVTPVDVDGDTVYYILELCKDVSVSTPVYERIGIFAQGITKTIIDISDYADGSNYKFRIQSFDDKGGIGSYVYSNTFQVLNTLKINDFEEFNGSIYMTASNGSVYRGTESIWELEEDFSDMNRFEIIKDGQAASMAENGKLTIATSTDGSYVLRIGKR